MGIRGGIFYLFDLVANCTAINFPYFYFQNCNQCSNMFPKLQSMLRCVSKINISRHVTVLLFSICPQGINTLHGWDSPAFPSQFSMPLQCLHPQLLLPPLSHLHLPTPSNPLICLSLQKSNVSMISKEITRLSNRISDLPEEMCISIINKPKFEL
jgi:hypothetical protein